MHTIFTKRKPSEKKNLSLLFAMVLIMALIAGIFISGCGKSNELSEKSDAAYDNAAVEEAAPVEGLVGEDVSKNKETAVTETGSAQKLITNWTINLETEKFDDFMNALRQNVKDCGGYIQSEDDNGSEGSRYASLTIRIPEDRTDGWVTKSTELGTVLSKSKSQRDVTLDYIDTESRLTALKSQRKALNRLLEKADSMEDIISIQNSLQDVNYQIESYESQLRYLQNDISYATVEMYVSEVNRESDTGTGLGSRIREEFSGSLNGVKAFAEGLLVFILGGAPIIIVLLLIIAVIILLIRKWKKDRPGKMGKEKAGKAGKLCEPEGENGETTLD